jgi:hypothetical protein
MTVEPVVPPDDGPTREELIQAYIYGGATPEEAKAAADEKFEPPDDPENYYVRHLPEVEYLPEDE